MLGVLEGFQRGQGQQAAGQHVHLSA
jgi:hypothetical protein